MSRRDFVAIAAEFRNLADEADTPEKREMLVRTAERMCVVFSDLNGRFDRARFLTACGM